MARDPLLLPPAPLSRGAMIRFWITRTFSGRAIVAGALVKMAAYLLGLTSGRTAAVALIDTAGDIAVCAGALVLGYRLFVDLKQRLLWRVRRKLTLSYIFIGFVPALLIITFFLLCGLLLVNNLGAHLITSRVNELERQTQLLAEMAAISVGNATTPAAIAEALAHRQAVADSRYPGVSYAAIVARNPCVANAPPPDAGETITAGPWSHTSPPPFVPGWVACGGHAGVMLYLDQSRSGASTGSAIAGTRTPARLLLRAVAWPAGDPGRAAVVDVPINAALAARLHEETGIELLEVAVVSDGGDNVLVESAPPGTSVSDVFDTVEQPRGLFRQRFAWVAFVDSTDWATGAPRPLTVGIRSSVADLYERIFPAGRAPGEVNFGQILLVLVAVVGASFLIIQLVAFGMGLALARSITGSVHELFAGTERVRRGDFTGRVGIRSRDQLGELAESFNSMTASIEDLLQQKAEKERLEQELRIARSIQMSLLPQGPMLMPGGSITAHCEPAREVGGDYYDFLVIDEYTVGILIADVSGKGTSAALYMAELKGVVLSLCQRHTSPRDLLIEADRIISRHLDSRSFITVTYLVVDLRAGLLRYSRAGHCPLIYVPGPYATIRDPQLMLPDGLVLGLQLDGGVTFARLLEEVTVSLGPGDLFLLYTDGMSEAMNTNGDCFGDARLAEIVGAHADLPADELRERILREIAGFAGAAPQHDDMTMVVLRVEQVGAAVGAMAAERTR